MIAGAMLGGGAFLLLSGDLSNGGNIQSLSPQSLRIATFISHICTFTLPGLLALYLCFQKKWWQQVNYRPFPGRDLGLVLLFGLVSLPLVGLSMWINLQIPLPEWAMKPEQETTEMLAKILTIDSASELIMALLTVAVAAGIGEELIFRGIFQKRLLGHLNHHLAIWIAAAIFSLIHFELAGFLPRMVLGAILGYIFHWSGSLIAVMLLHAVFNGSQVIATYISGTYTPDTDAVELPQWYLLLGSFVLTIGLAYFLESKQYDDEKLRA